MSRLFYGVLGRELPTITYRRAWIAAREKALAAGRQAYDLRHTCVSTWLNAGVPATQVAQSAGHNVEVLLRIYAKCIVGQEETAKRRISEPLGGG